MKQDVNYITHHKAAFKRLCDEESLNSQHLSLYNALFLLWNLSEFEESFPIVRSDVMRMSKIGSANTYTACLKKLHELGYIDYKPSQNPMVCSTVSFYRFDNSIDNTTDNSSDKGVVIPAVKVLRRNTVNNTNNTNNKSDSAGEKTKLQNYIAEKYSFVTKMNKQLTFLESEKISSTYTAVQIKDILDAMENYKDLVKKNNSVYLTILNWAKRRGYVALDPTKQIKVQTKSIAEQMEDMRNG